MKFAAFAKNLSGINSQAFTLQDVCRSLLCHHTNLAVTFNFNDIFKRQKSVKIHWHN